MFYILDVRIIYECKCIIVSRDLVMSEVLRIYKQNKTIDIICYKAATFY